VDRTELADFLRHCRTRLAPADVGLSQGARRRTVRHADTKRFLHPVVGLLELDCEVLLNPEHDQRLIVYTARPGSRSYERLELLRVVGLQDLTRG
jgi:hypothetical protein